MDYSGFAAGSGAGGYHPQYGHIQYQQQPPQPYDPAAPSQPYEIYGYSNYGSSTAYGDPYYGHYSSSSLAAAGYQPQAPAAVAAGTGYEVPQELHGSAVAAFSQLTELTGSMERSMVGVHEQHLPHGQHMYPPPHRSHGSRGGGSFRGGRRGGPSRGGGRGSVRGGRGIARGRGSFARGQGRNGRGGGKRSAPQPETAPLGFAPVQYEVPEPRYVPFPGQEAKKVNASTVAKAPRQRAWCDVCRVDCTSLDILESHKNGKRHKKTLRALQRMEAQQQAINGGAPNEYAHEQPSLPVSHLNETFVSSAPPPVVQMEAHPVMHRAPAALPQITSTNDAAALQFTEMQDPSMLNVPVVAEGSGPQDKGRQEERWPLSNDVKTRGKKRKTAKAGVGNKRMKMHAEPAPHPPKPERPREHPQVCTVCNVSSDADVVFQTHLAGKRHLAKVQRSLRPDTIFGQIFVYIPPDQPSRYPPGTPDPIFYGIRPRNMDEQLVALRNEIVMAGADQLPQRGNRQARKAGAVEIAGSSGLDRNEKAACDAQPQVVTIAGDLTLNSEVENAGDTGGPKLAVSELQPLDSAAVESDLSVELPLPQPGEPAEKDENMEQMVEQEEVEDKVEEEQGEEAAAGAEGRDEAAASR